MRLASLPAILALALPLAAQQPIVVDASGGGDFTSLADAIGAAASGDLIVVRTGVYQGALAIDAKGLTIAAEGGSDVHVQTPAQFRIENLAADQAVTLHGIRFTTQSGIWVEDCAGPVLFQDCVVELLATTVTDALFALNCEAVSAVRTTIDLSAQVIQPAFFVGGRALRAFDSNVFLHDCELLGSIGPPGIKLAGIPVGGFPGNAAVHVEGGRVVARGCTLTGGTGGLGFFDGTTCTNGGPGGAAVVLVTSPVTSEPAELVRVGTRLVGGEGGAAAGGSCLAGAKGPVSTVAPGSSLVASPIAARSFEADCLVADGATLTGTFHGPPGDFVALAYTPFTGNPLWAPNVAGPFYLEFPMQTLNLGFLNASGVKVVTYLNEDPGLPWVPLWIQPFHFGVEQQLVVSNPRLVLLLDAP